VGAGFIGRQHIQRILENPSMELAGIIDPSVTAKEYAISLHARYFTDLSDCVRKVSLDGLIIATPNRSHVANGLVAVEAGIPMLVEKPISHDLASALKLVEAAEEAGIPILVGHHRRHSPLIREAKRIVASGRLGRVLAVSGFCLFRKPANYFEGEHAWRGEAGAGVMLINLVHAIDDLRNLVGDIAGVQAAASNATRGLAVDDTAAVLLHFASGALGTLTISDAVASPWSWEMTSHENDAFPNTDEFCYLVAGTEASLTVPRLDVWHHTGESWLTPIEKQRVVVTEEDPLKLQLQHFGAVIRGEAVPLLGGRGGARTLETTLAVHQAAATGKLVPLS
jgi:predicted dehydrogenase